MIASAAIGLCARIVPSIDGWIYELAAPYLCAILIIILWRRSTLRRHFNLFIFAPCLGWVVDWLTHAFLHQPDSPRAFGAGLILLVIRISCQRPVIILPHQFLSNRPLPNRCKISRMDITNPKLLYCKASLFLLMGTISAALILLDHPTLKIAALLLIAIWSFARCYYFIFYVIQHYIDPTYKFAGLTSFLRYLLSRPRP